MRSAHIGITALVLVFFCGITGASIRVRVDPAMRSSVKMAASVLDAEAGESNQAMSPWSLELALRLAAEGARGRTQDAIFNTLAGATVAPDAIPTFGADPAISKDPAIGAAGIDFRVANVAFGAKDFHFRPAFLQRIVEGPLAASAQTVDFADPKALGMVNEWFGKATGGKIPKLLDELPTSTRFLLGSAFYFKAPWADAFDPKLTLDEPFVSQAGSRRVPMMRAKRRWLATSNDDGSAVVMMPFRGGRFAMAAILPPTGTSPLDWLSKSPERVAQMIGGDTLRNEERSVVLPKFNIESGGDISGKLRKAGLEPAFSSDADFLGMASEATSIGTIAQRVTFAIDETGAEAAAATAVISSRSASPGASEIRFDRPFLAVLLARSELDETAFAPADTVLMVAAVQDPAPSKGKGR